MRPALPLSLRFSLAFSLAFSLTLAVPLVGGCGEVASSRIDPRALTGGTDASVSDGGGTQVPDGGSAQVPDPGSAWTGPYPVVIAAGAFAPASVYDPMVARLAESGFEAYVYVIPTPLRNIEYTAPTLAAFVDDVMARTGAPKVSIVSHSQGGLLSRYYIRFLGGLENVDTLVSLSGLHYGSTLANVPVLLGVPNCIGVEICQELLPGSPLLALLDEPIDVDGDIHYVNITSTFEEAAIPYTNNFHRDVTSGDVTNFTVQDQCPFRFVEHATLATDGSTAHAVVDALARRPIDITDDCYGW